MDNLLHGEIINLRVLVNGAAELIKKLEVVLEPAPNGLPMGHVRHTLHEIRQLIEGANLRAQALHARATGR